MKLLYNIPATYRSGGMERVLADKANWLVAQGYEVQVVTCDQAGREAFYQMDERIRFVDLDINYEANNGGSLMDKLIHYPLRQFRHRRRLQAVVDEYRPDVTISMFGNEVGMVPKLRNVGKTVLEVHFSRDKRLLYRRGGLWGVIDRYRNHQDGRLAARYDRFVVLTEEDRPSWGRMNNICVIPNASPYHPFEPSPLDSKVVFSAGRLSFQKGYERLVEAWSMLAAEFPEWRLVIAGDGEERAALESMIAEAGLAKSITLMPPTREIEKCYAGASVIALSSRYEGLPMILIEAQSFGLPIVAFSCKCGPKDIVTDGVDGFLAPEGDVCALADGLSRLMADDSLRQRMGTAAFNASERYSEDSVMAQWDNLFKELICRR